MDIRRIAKYWFMILKISAENAIKILGLKERDIYTFLYYPVLLAFSLFVGNFSDKYIRQIMGDVQGDMRKTILDLAIFFIVVFLSILSTPPKLHEEMGGFDKWNIKTDAEDQGLTVPEKNIAIRFTSNMQNDVTEFYVEIVSIIDTVTGLEILSNPEILLFSSRHQPQDQNKTLGGLGNLLVSVAETKSNKNQIWVTTRYRPRDLKPGKYKMIIQVYGVINKKFREKYQFFINYEGGTNLYFRPKIVEHM